MSEHQTEAVGVATFRRLMAFAHREESFLLDFSTVVSDPTESVRAAAQTWRDDMWHLTHPWGTGGAYANFPDPTLENGEAAYHGPNLTKLRAIKRRYDPDDRIRFHQSLTPA